MGEELLTDAPLASGSEVAAGGENSGPDPGSSGGGGEWRALVPAVVASLVVTSEQETEQVLSDFHPTSKT